MSSILVLDVPVACTTRDAATSDILTWARAGASRYVCLVNTHMLVEAWGDPAFREVLERADLNCADGLPVAWMQARLGASKAEHIRGADLMISVLVAASDAGVRVGFYGGKPEVLEQLTRSLHGQFPSLDIAYTCSPPFRPLSPEEDAEVVDAIASARVGILFVGLGCPKQERWMAAHRDRVPAVMLGVGAAFDMHAGVLRQAPAWIQQAGLEWMHRLLADPRRLLARYARNNPRFVLLALRQLARHHRERARRAVPR